MSLITQCPACSTMFRVVPDQLRISEGWVRCGQCDEVFDANAHLRSLDDLTGEPQPFAAPPAAPNPHPVEEPAGDGYEATRSAPMQVEALPLYDWGSVMPEPEPPPAIPASPEMLSFEPDGPRWTQDFALSPVPLAEQDPAGALLADEPAGADEEPIEADTWAATELAALAPLDAGEPEPLDQVVPARDPLSDDGPLPSFMAAGTATSSPGHGVGKRSLLAATVVLAMLLAAQVLMQERNRVAAYSPAWQPLLQVGCEVMACMVLPLREIESIAIDSSAFTSVRPGVYLLQVSLKNNAASELATPALELTLTDTQDRPLLRRVVLPTELSDKPAMPVGSELVARLPISVKPGAVPEKIAGYKLLAFYP